MAPDIIIVQRCPSCNSKLEQGDEKFCPRCGENLLQFQSDSMVIVECMLPIKINYEEIADPKIENRSKIKVSRGALELYPYYVFDYTLNARRKDSTGKAHKLENAGKHIIDAVSGELVSASSSTIAELKSFLHNLVFKDHKENRSEAVKGPSSNTEKSQVVEDLKNIEPIYNYAFNLTDKYSLNIIDDKAPLKMSEKIVLKRIKEDNTAEISYTVKRDRDKTEKEKMEISPTYNEIKINKSYLVYIPIWIITFKACGMTYDRKVLAAYSTFIVDEISLCPKHYSFGRILGIKKRTYALCDICGIALCFDHALKRKGSYFCEEDANASSK